MWILTILSNSVIHLIFGLGILGTIAGFFLGFIPFIKQYKLAIQISSVITLIFGIYLEGGLADYKEWQLKVKEMEAKVAEAEKKSAQENTKLVEKIITQKQIVKEKGNEIVKYVDREIVKYDTKYIKGGECELPQEVIKAHNAGATGKGIENADTQLSIEEINKTAKGEK